MMGPIERALMLGRFFRDGAALVLWGCSVFLILTPASLRASLATFYGRLRFISLMVLVAAVLALLPVQSAFLADDWSGAFDPASVGALLLDTTIGTAWLVQGTTVVILVIAPSLSFFGRLVTTATASGLLLMSLSLTGHAAMHDGWPGLVQRGGTVLHLLAAGFWFGALPAVLRTLGLLGDPIQQGGAIVALRRFSAWGHVAVASTLVTGILDALLILHPWPTPWESVYLRLLAAKVLLVAAMTGLALLNRYVFVPRLRDAPVPTIHRMRRATLAAVALGWGAVALVATFGLYDPT